MTSPEIRPFRIDVPAEEVERLKRKLRDTRLPGRPIVPNAGSSYGPTYQWAENLYKAWVNDYDWYSVQAEMNQVPHYITAIVEINIHFVHVRAKSPNAIPLLMVHGWPGSFWEFSQIWSRLSCPPNDKEISFHVVVPSMPGFSGWTLRDTARIFDKLMKRLGYNQYMVQCGDWGHFVGRELASQYTNSCRLIHCNFSSSSLPQGVEYTEREKEVAHRADDWLENHMGYAVCMRTRPHTIGIALHDNPMGILMWAGEKYNEAADPKAQEQPFWTKAILTTASLYYFTNCIMPSILCYYENAYHENAYHENFAEFGLRPENRIKVSFGYTSFYWDTEPSSRRAVERTGNLVFYRDM
ncbi:epoxide hydrolase [Aspergillus sclerotioniger CBS 115572]|uniref:Epoxide hydrolase n=1 Tax=Aspergillus sclerotioniger CBS 115572 TaxID=1450535 RepID=A0A317XCF6_9EURO|nr:epoxide hydrolase [Aspergillus sclerotioniger CBS 115572]PWY96223.1 epoxide hydrolase [Aspergillus sclerotioniger CBS 115572]